MVGSISVVESNDPDTDSDGTPDSTDLDDDGDGYTDIEEATAAQTLWTLILIPKQTLTQMVSRTRVTRMMMGMDIRTFKKLPKALIL
jgi:hypothetical protein